ncbi:LacI family DNA-binding transcriptional regulator [Kribbella sp.]|uniref:LacI family DNA-binding transcriptional regulator n=1 Tax=Kribbella sp. TaxID=1871183 RepID=UPI002D4FE931|nr:LacI family DNA-binding transcriptional regulator [Kribbella sp.]HZX08752.1 LacI family DNA-binding transcriptional regulator [Kribbella sp.]
MKSIADELGVSISTVSRAFSHPELLSRERREQILSVANRVGYQPNRTARGLATGQTSVLGLMVPDITNPFFPPLVRAAENRANERGYALMLTDTDEHAERERLLMRELTSRVDGLVVCSPRSASAPIKQVATTRPVVLVNRTIPGLTSVTCSVEAGATALMEHLRELGHRRVAYLSGPASSWSDKDKRSCVQRAARRLRMTVDVLGPFPATFEGGLSAAEQVAAQEVTAALAYDDVMALGTIRGLRDQGLDVPGAVSVSGCDDVLFSSMTVPGLTTIAMPMALAGRTAVDLLLDQLEKSARTQQVVLSSDFVPRASTGPAA